jgi:formylglycine-generating enzyme required for sulfatase activity
LVITNDSNSAKKALWPTSGLRLGDTGIEFVKQIAQGGSGRVYKGVKLVDGKSCVVALKVCLKPSSLKREFKCHQRIGKHNNVVTPPISHLQSKEYPCLEYEYSVLGDLRKYVRDFQGNGGVRRLTPMQATTIFLQIVKGVAHAHSLKGKAVIHRDLKPGNVLVFADRDGKPEFRVTDFGMAHASRNQKTPILSAASLTETVVPGGTVDYMSPQQRACEEPDKRDDVYSLGKIWFQLLANDLDSPIGSDLKTALTEIKPEIEWGFRKLVEHCIDEDRTGDMPIDAADLLKKLDALICETKAKLSLKQSPNRITLELEDFLKCNLHPSRYTKYFKIKNELVVDFAIVVPGSNKLCRLFVDSSFPCEYFDRYFEQTKSGVRARIKKASDALKKNLFDHARSISEKYSSYSPIIGKVMMFLPSNYYKKIPDSDKFLSRIAKDFRVEICHQRLLKKVFQIHGVISSNAWVVPEFTVLEEKPDESVVTNSDFRDRIIATELPWRIRDIGTNIEMLLIPPGRFMMGASSDDSEAASNEIPAHEVLISNAFYLGRTPVTQAQWTAKMGGNPWGFQSPTYTLDTSRPVEAVSWDMIQEFNTLTGLRLPTEAEWEYACRAGSSTPRYGMLNDIAWYSDNSGEETRAVATKLPNALGLYDTLGNVWEWCQDLWGPYPPRNESNPAGPTTGSSRLLRGGGWVSHSSYCRASARFWHTHGFNESGIGFRAVMTP